jgi:hypothetical protein
LIEEYFPLLPKIELNARRRPKDTPNSNSYDLASVRGVKV